MQVTLYSSTADPRRVHKQQYLTKIATVDAIIYYPLVIEAPKFEFRYIRNYINVNYAYVPELNRYYFTNSPTLESGRTIVITCEVDPLMSFKDDILNLNCICIRNEKKFNEYITDNNIPSSVKGTTTNYLINDSTPFIIPESDEINCYVLTLNGLVGEVRNE